MNISLRILNTLITALLVIASPAASLCEERPLKLGAVLPLSGDLAFYGTEIRNGITLAAQESTSPVELYLEDAPLVGSKIISALNKLVEMDHIDAIAGNFSNVAMLSMASKINHNQIPSFHSAAIDEDILAASDWIFSTNVRVADEGRHVAEFVYEAKQKRRAAVLSVMTNFGQGYRKAFAARFKELGGVITTEEQHTPDTFDFRSQLTRIKASEPDVIFLGTFGPFLGSAVRQLRELGVTVPIYTVYEAEDESVVSAAGKGALEGIRYFVSYQENSAFSEEYFSAFGRIPTTFARNSFDATKLLIAVFNECKFEKVCVQKHLYATKAYPGVSGNISIDPDGASTKQFVLHGYQDGEFRPVSE